jgi:signal transduction histidine kinase
VSPKGKPARTLSFLLSFYLGTGMLVLTLFVAAALHTTVGEFLDRTLREKAEALANQLAVITLDAALIRDYGTIERYVDELVGRQDLLFIEISRNDGELLGRAGKRIEGQPLVSRPIRLLNDRLGEVTVQYDRRPVAALALQTTLTAAGALLVAGAAFFFVLQRLLKHNVILPVRQLVDRLSPTGTDPILPEPKAPAEVVELSNRFNTLQGKIREHILELEQTHQAHNDAIRRLCSDQRLVTIGQMAAELAHEMNTPLSNILGYAKTARARTEDPDLSRRLDVIADQARRLKQIVSDMLAAVRPPAPQGQVVDFAALLESIARLIGPILSKHAVTLRIVNESKAASCWADPTMTEQIVFNLTSNAVQAQAHQLLLRIYDDAASLALEVTDDGDGIPSAIRAKLFEPFVTSKTAGQGTGLGLSISQRLASEMGGMLELVDSRPGQTVFRLRLPREKASAGAAA